MRAALRFGNDFVDHPEFQKVLRCQFERLSGFSSMSPVSPQNRGACIQTNHGVVVVLENQNAICDPDAERASRATLTDHCGNDGDAQLHHLTKVHSDRLRNVALLRSDTWKSARRIDEGNYRHAEFFAETHQAQRLAIALRMRAPEVAHHILLGIAPLLVSDNDATLAAEHRHSAWHCAIVGKAAVAVQLNPVRKTALNVIEREWPLSVPRDLDPLPGRQIAVNITTHF